MEGGDITETGTPETARMKDEHDERRGRELTGAKILPQAMAY